MSTTERLIALRTVPSIAKQAILEAEGDEIVDVLGTLNSVQSQIGRIKLNAASEVETETAGSEWQYERSRKGVRSYNNSGMFTTLMGQLSFDGLLPLLMHLLELDVIRLSWQWSNLEKLLHGNDVFLRTAHHEVAEGDPDYDMGTYWTDGSASYKRVED